VLEIFDIRGRLVRRLAGGHEAAGRVTMVWDGMAQDGRRAAAGAYVYRIRHAGEVGTGRLVLLDR
jgi:flagellar hook assembly protein FlgD